jgi:DNA-binding CsgD family transcriptional regulator
VAGTNLSRELEVLGATLDESLEALKMSVVLVDPSGTVRWQNAASVARVGERRGTHYLGVVAPDYRRLARTEFIRLLFGAGGSRLELVILDRAGRRMRLLLTSTSVRSGELVVGVLLVALPLGWDDSTVPAPHLPPRQLETLRLLAAGYSTAKIARELGVTLETARNYIRRLLKRLGAHSRVEAVARGRAVGLVASDPSASSEAWDPPAE